jgi:hypothetical protein
MTKWFIMEHRSGAVGLASVPVKRRDGITQTFDTREAAAMAAKRRMSVACVSYTVEAIDCSPCPLLFGDPLLFGGIHNRGGFAADEAESGG